MNSILGLVVLLLSFATAIFAYRRNRSQDCFKKLLASSLALVPLAGPLAYFICFHAPSVQPNTLRAYVSGRPSGGARVIQEMEPNVYRGDGRADRKEPSLEAHMPNAGRRLFGIAKVLSVTALISIAAVGHYLLLSK